MMRLPYVTLSRFDTKWRIARKISIGAWGSPPRNWKNSRRYLILSPKALFLDTILLKIVKKSLVLQFQKVVKFQKTFSYICFFRQIMKNFDAGSENSKKANIFHSCNFLTKCFAKFSKILQPSEVLFPWPPTIPIAFSVIPKNRKPTGATDYCISKFTTLIENGTEANKRTRYLLIREKILLSPARHFEEVFL